MAQPPTKPPAFLPINDEVTAALVNELQAARASIYASESKARCAHFLHTQVDPVAAHARMAAQLLAEADRLAADLASIDKTLATLAERIAAKGSGGRYK